MKPQPAFVEHCLELWAAACSGAWPGNAARARSMFGGWGLYSGDLFVALIANDEMFVKVDAQSQPQFVAALCKPFVYEAKSKVMTLSFWTVPAEAMDAAHLLAPWAQLAVQAALRARVPRSSKATRAAQESTSKQTSKHKRLR